MSVANYEIVQEWEEPQELQDLLNEVREFRPNADLPRIRYAFYIAEQAHAGQTRSSGEAYITHPLAVAQILARLGVDDDTLVAALLHDVLEDTPHSEESIKASFGEEVVHLVEGVTKLRIKTPQDAYRMWEHTRCDGIMIGRGSFGQPWIFRQTRALLDKTPYPETPGVHERFAVALDHARMVQEYEIDPLGAALEFRKHLGWYVKGLPNSAELRKVLHQVRDFSEVEGIFARYLEEYDDYRARGVGADDSDIADLTCEAA